MTLTNWIKCRPKLRDTNFRLARFAKTLAAFVPKVGNGWCDYLTNFLTYVNIYIWKKNVCEFLWTLYFSKKNRFHFWHLLRKINENFADRCGDLNYQCYPKYSWMLRNNRNKVQNKICIFLLPNLYCFQLFQVIMTAHYLLLTWRMAISSVMERTIRG